MREECLKDCHLIESALGSDNTIGSADDRARRRFARVAQRHDDVGEIVWANPATEGDPIVDWIERGAPEEDSRRLINYL